MRNLIFEKHDPTQAPKTYFRTSEGRIIDGIWGTETIQVKQCGYLEPGDFPGDHSMMWVDLAYDEILGHKMPEPTYPDARKLKLHDSKAVSKYLDEYERLLSYHQVPARHRRLTQSTTYGVPLSATQCREADAIDVIKTKCMLKAEHKCRKLRMGAVYFSEATELPRRQIAFWEIAIRRRLGLTISPRLWRRKKEAAAIKTTIHNLDLPGLYLKLKEAKQAYRKAKKEHKQHRQTFIETFAPKDCDRIRRTEEQRQLGRISCSITGKLDSKSVTKIEINGEECSDQGLIEATLLDVNEAKIHASDDTPFLTQPLLSDFGYRNNTHNCDAVLRGQYEPPPGTHPATALLLRHLAAPPAPSASLTFRPALEITLDDHIKGWKRAKERTAAGMSRITFAMYKAHIKRKHLAELDCQQRNLAYCNGFSFRRWKKGLDVQLLKRKRDYRPNKLRTILCLEADHNMNNKVIGRDSMRYGERRKLLARDNYGGRKNYQAPEVGLNQQLTGNSLWARRGRAVLMSNDAKGCYDRIAHVVVSLALQRLGIPKPPLASMLETIQEMEHHVCTAFGRSQGYYGNDPTKPPPSGILQGNGAGPTGWFAIATALINAMREAGFGYKQWSVIKQRAIHIVCFAFVDDTDIIHANDDPQIDTATVIAEAQQGLSLWSDMLHATGGALAPEKSYWYLIEIKRKNGKWQYVSQADQPGDLYLQNGAYKIKRQEPHQANEALGIQVRPDGSMADEVRYLRQKATSWAEMVRTKHISQHEAWYCLNSTIMNTISYPLTATSMTYAECDSIMKPILKTILPKAKIQRNLPRKLLYGPRKYQGLNLHHPYWTQLIKHLHCLMTHCARDSPTQDLLQENIELVQLHVGSDQPFWTLPFALYGPLAPSGWIKNTWEALDQTPLTLRGGSEPQPALRAHDVHLMDAFLALDPPAEDLQSLQNCRLYLQVYSLAGLTNAAGTRISDAAWNGRSLPHYRPLNWINTHKPTKNEWTLWQSYLRRAFLYPHAQHRRLRQPLGPWPATTSPDSDPWIWWQSPQRDYLYQRTGHNWTRWTRSPTTRARQKYIDPTPTSLAPQPLCYRVDAEISRTATSAVVHTREPQRPNPPPAQHTTFTTLLQAAPPTQRWAIATLLRTDEGTQFATALRQGTALAVSDGSLKVGLGTSAFILVDRTNLTSHPIQGVNKVPGPIAEGDSHRCELAGLYAIVSSVNMIAMAHGVTDGQVEVACDNISSLGVFDEEFLPKPKHKNFDLLKATHTLLRLSPVRWKHTHVDGHQDTKKPNRPLSLLEQLNVAMDRMAKSYWTYWVNNSPSFPQPPHIDILGEGIQLWSGDSKLVHPSTDALYDLVQGQTTKNWWICHRRIRDTAIDLIDWSSNDDHLRTLPTPRRTWVTKHASKNCGVGTTLLAWKYQTDAECPRCACTREDTAHVLRCRGHGADQIFDSSLTSLTSTLESLATDPELILSLSRILKAWRTCEPIQMRTIPVHLRSTIREQQAIGWKNLLEGLPTKLWQRAQQSYYADNHIRKSSRRWLRSLLRGLHHLAWNMWQHRNDVKHRLAQPRLKKAVALLDKEITTRYLQGPTTLLPGDRYHLQRNLQTLLNKPISYKKNWLLNIHAAQQKHWRITHEDDTFVLTSPSMTWLLQWFDGHQP